VARVGSSVILSGPIARRRGGQLRRGWGRSTDDAGSPGAWHGSRSSCSSAAGAAHEFEVPAGDMAHA
jgi:hypothetical protein